MFPYLFVTEMPFELSYLAIDWFSLSCTVSDPEGSSVLTKFLCMSLCIRIINMQRNWLLCTTGIFFLQGIKSYLW